MADIERRASGRTLRRAAGIGLALALTGTTLLGVTGCADSGDCPDDDYAAGLPAPGVQADLGDLGTGGRLLARGSHGGSHGGYHGGGSVHHYHHYHDGDDDDYDDDSCGSYSPSPSYYSPSPTATGYPWQQDSASPDSGDLNGLN